MSTPSWLVIIAGADGRHYAIPSRGDTEDEARREAKRKVIRDFRERELRVKSAERMVI